MSGTLPVSFRYPSGVQVKLSFSQLNGSPKWPRAPDHQNGLESFRYPSGGPSLQACLSFPVNGSVNRSVNRSVNGSVHGSVNLPVSFPTFKSLAILWHNFSHQWHNSCSNANPSNTLPKQRSQLKKTRNMCAFLACTQGHKNLLGTTICMHFLRPLETSQNIQKII